MKPITLTMKAFGSFAKETTVSFRDFRNGLFLVVGDTGAGKTTIFDAIVFALYGVASGSSRKPEMMHSDFVPLSEDTEVTLVFEQGEREYTVTRSIHFAKIQGRKGEYRKGKIDAVLLSPEGPPITVAGSVSRRCEELLGLNAEQFRRIVMLAQGEFRKFLSADAKEKSEILGKLFDNSEYVRFQNLLEQSRDALKRQRDDYRKTIETQMNTLFQRPESDTPEDEARYLPGAPDLVENLDRLIGSEEQKRIELDAAKAEKQQAVDALNKKKGAAEGNNKLLESLAEAQRHLSELNQKREEMEHLQQEYERAEQAVRHCVPQQEKWEGAKARAQQTEQAIQSLQQTICKWKEQCADRQAAVEEDQPRRQRIEEINLEGKRLADSLPQYDTLESRQSERIRSEKQLRVWSDELEQKQVQEAEGKKALTECQSELAQLENAGAEEMRQQAAYETAQNAVKEFGTIQRQLVRLRSNEGVLREAQKVLNRLTAEAAGAEQRYHRLYQRFVSGQAGLLAARLEDNLNRDGRAVCPVCHSVFRVGEPHDFAGLVEGTPSQEAVDAAKQAFEQTEQSRSAQLTEIKRQEEALLLNRNYLLERMQKLLPDCESWEQFSSQEYLTHGRTQLNLTRDEAKRRYEDAHRQRLRQAALKEEQKRLVKELTALGEEIRQSAEAIHHERVRIAGLKAEEEALRKHLPFAEKGEARARMQALAVEREGLQAVIDAHRAALDEATEQRNSACGALKEKEHSLPKQKAEEAEAHSAFVSALSKHGFADAEEVQLALMPIGRENGEAWLKRRSQILNEYKNDCRNTEGRVTELTEQTKNLSYTDLEKLNRALEDAQAKRDAAEHASSVQNSLLQNHRQVRGSVAGARGMLNRTDKAWERLDRLANLAVGIDEGGKSVDGGKLSFERYVMGAIFREVLDMANRRLDIMSGGHYELVHTVKGATARSAAGLEIEVLDVTTGRQRPANSLSGGESFQVSLSLALGLSDVVQSHAGGVGLDTIFIDEGFGALDGSRLDSAITVLNQLTEGNRLVGIISHVDKLEESIPQKLRVTKTALGSQLSLELS